VNVDKVIQFLSVIGDEVDAHYLKKSKEAADQYVKTVQKAQQLIHGQTVVFNQPFFGAEVDFIVNEYREFIAQGKNKEEIVEEEDDEETKKSKDPQDAPKNAAEKLERMKKLMARQTQTGVENYIVANTVHEKQFSTDYYNQEAGWKDEYYQKKFELDTGAIVEKTRKQVCKDVSALDPFFNNLVYSRIRVCMEVLFCRCSILVVLLSTPLWTSYIRL
jgi:5'-3' exonuclease